MLGKGLSSLIPPKKPQQPQPTEEDFVSPQTKPATANEKPAASFGKSARPPETLSFGEVGRVSEAERAWSPTAEGASEERTDLPAGRQGVKNAPTRRRSETSGSDRKASGASEAIFQIEVEKIKPNPHQPRRNFDEEALKELASSIREFGILQPLVVFKIEKETEFGTDVEYQLIAGERRLMAAKMLGWERVPAIVRKIEQKSEQLAMAVIENLQRANLNPIETARAYAKLQDQFGLTQREIAAKIGKSRESVANTLRLLNLPSEIQEAVAQNQINESQARLLLVIEDLTQQRNLFQELLKNNLSVRELKNRIRKTGQDTPAEERVKAIDPELIDFQEKLTELLGARVKIISQSDSEKSAKGKIVITFFSPEEIQGIIEKLKPDSQTNL